MKAMVGFLFFLVFLSSAFADSSSTPIGRLCAIAEGRAQNEFENIQKHPDVVRAEADIRLQVNFLRSVFIRLKKQDWEAVANYARDSQSARNAEESAEVESRYRPLRDAIMRILDTSSIFEPGSQFQLRECPEPGSKSYEASQVSGLNDWRDTLREFYPTFVRSCPSVQGTNHHRHTLPLLQRSYELEWAQGRAEVRARTFRQLARQDGQTFLALESRLNLGLRIFEGLHFPDSVKATNAPSLQTAAITRDAYLGKYLRKNGVYNLCRQDEVFLDATLVDQDGEL